MGFFKALYQLTGRQEISNSRQGNSSLRPSVRKFVPSAVKENFFSSPANQVEDLCQHGFPPSLFQGQICPVRRPVSKSSGKSTIPDFWTWTADPQSNSDIFVWCPSCLLACPANAARRVPTLSALPSFSNMVFVKLTKQLNNPDIYTTKHH